MAFHPQPQLLRAVFNPHRFGPPRGFTPASAWPRLDHFGFVSAPGNSTPFSGSLSLRHRTLSPSPRYRGATRWLIKQKARCQTGKPVLQLIVRARFQGLFHSPSGVLFTFPSRYYALSVIDSYLALDGGPPGFGQDCTCPVLLGIPLGPVPARYGAITLFGRTFQPGSLAFAWSHVAVPQPRTRRPGLGSSPFARHYWGNLI